jgi:putative transposase
MPHPRRLRGTIIHSGKGTQFRSDTWRRFYQANHLEPSMGCEGSCRDYAVPESFFSSLKKEWINKHIYKIQELAIVDIVDYVDTFYS